MSEDAARFAQLRDLRAEAWEQVRKDVEGLRTGLKERPIGTRIKDAATDEMVDAIDTARDVAAENKTVIRLTIAALIAWFARRPLTGWAQDLGDAVADALDR